MTIDDVQEIIAPTESLHERVSKIQRPVAVYVNSQHLGNRVVSRVYPEHWARVIIARHTWKQYGGGI